ncbi:MAG: hypothetical protein LH614_03195 [Pyrinomonadaceae bacterium]|nr:hypothetical protein [Pyrinomonadaceae bacterium]
MSKKSLIFILALIVAVGGGAFVWRTQNARAKDARIEAEILKKLSAEEINLVLESQADSGISGIKENADTRRAFLKAMREYLALAAQARRDGLTEEANFKINFEYKKNLLLAGLYKARLSSE